MSGHSHWATIRRKKGSVDAKKGRVFSKCAKLIMSAARTGGGDPDMNLSLRYAIDDARSVNMPKDKIDRAILKGTGELDGASLDVVVYEGYGPAGVALMVETLTDNRNRTAADIRHIFEAAGGTLGGPGTVAWMFEKKGVISVKLDAAEEDKLLDIILEAGAEDLTKLEDVYEITCDPSAFSDVRQALTDNGVTPETAEMTNVASQNVKPSLDDARKILKLMEALEDHDDVSNVSASFEIPAELVAEIT
ncbi:MAG: YebC/PmpR family DNA-binding transcriptional regulator [Planctomycetota bacterium]